MVGCASGSNIGSTSGTNFKQVTVTFPTAFAAIPGTIVCAVRNPDDGNTYTDVFTATIANATATGFTVNVRRDNGPGDWTQHLMPSWLALPYNTPDHVVCLSRGSTLLVGFAGSTACPLSPVSTFYCPQILEQLCCVY